MVETTHMGHRPTWQNCVLGLVGTVVGGAIGYWLFFWITRQGFYAMVLPGALMGLGCGALSGFKSHALGVTCGVQALLLGLYIEWKFAPFVADDSLTYFLSHVHHLKSMTLLMIGLGGVFGYWFGRGRDWGALRESTN